MRILTIHTAGVYVIFVGVVDDLGMECSTPGSHGRHEHATALGRSEGQTLAYARDEEDGWRWTDSRGRLDGGLKAAGLGTSQQIELRSERKGHAVVYGIPLISQLHKGSAQVHAKRPLVAPQRNINWA